MKARFNVISFQLAILSSASQQSGRIFRALLLPPLLKGSPYLVRSEDLEPLGRELTRVSAYCCSVCVFVVLCVYCCRTCCSICVLLSYLLSYVCIVVVLVVLYVYFCRTCSMCVLLSYLLFYVCIVVVLIVLYVCIAVPVELCVCCWCYFRCRTAG